MSSDLEDDFSSKKESESENTKLDFNNEILQNPREEDKEKAVNVNLENNNIEKSTQNILKKESINKIENNNKNNNIKGDNFMYDVKIFKKYERANK